MERRIGKSKRFQRADAQKDIRTQPIPIHTTSGTVNDTKDDQPDDYLSDQFLQTLEQRGSAMSSSNFRSKRRANKKRPEKLLPLHQRMEERREEGLAQQISQDNIGFKLLSKMGFKEGKGLGKEKQGILAPVGVEIKNDKSGLGKSAQIKEKIAEKARAHHQIATERTGDFARAQRAQFLARRLRGHLQQARAVCRQLDLAAGKNRSFLWPGEDEDDEGADVGDGVAGSELDKQHQDPIFKPVEEHEEENYTDEVPKMRADVEEMFSEYTQFFGRMPHSESPWEEQDDEGKLDIATKYLRRTYYHCIYCGCKYKDTLDLEAHCPGNTFDDH
mmetsp:Transcript_1694/g.2821  ORF Transcript_1694/g.2821 Transcript_1694/m.2821 type:complete len:331 (-) Transcript_1694:245-1237(-)